MKKQFLFILALGFCSYAYSNDTDERVKILKEKVEQLTIEQLIKAIQENDLKGVNKAIKDIYKYKININTPYENPLQNKDTALHYAVMYQEKDIILTLIANGADANAKNKSSQTPKYYASFHASNKDILKLLDMTRDEAQCEIEKMSYGFTIKEILKIDSKIYRCNKKAFSKKFSCEQSFKKSPHAKDETLETDGKPYSYKKTNFIQCYNFHKAVQKATKKSIFSRFGSWIIKTCKFFT